MAPWPTSATARSSSACLRPVMKTFAPSEANRLAVASPMPLLPPVTTATLPSSLPIEPPPFGCEVGTGGMIEHAFFAASTYLFVSIHRISRASPPRLLASSPLTASLEQLRGKCTEIMPPVDPGVSAAADVDLVLDPPLLEHFRERLRAGREGVS